MAARITSWNNVKKVVSKFKLKYEHVQIVEGKTKEGM